MEREREREREKERERARGGGGGKKDWMEGDETYGPAGMKPQLLAEVDDEEDAEEVERMENFESKYNFRFEQEGGTEIISYGRHVEVGFV